MQYMTIFSLKYFFYRASGQKSGEKVAVCALKTNALEKEPLIEKSREMQKNTLLHFGKRYLTYHSDLTLVCVIPYCRFYF